MSKRIIISEGQYDRIFFHDGIIIKEQDDKPKDYETDNFYYIKPKAMGIGGEELYDGQKDVDLNFGWELSQYGKEEKERLLQKDTLGLDSNINYTVVADKTRVDPSYLNIPDTIQKSWQPQTIWPKMERAALDYNSVLGHWSNIRGSYHWKDAKIIMVDDKWLGKHKENSLKIMAGESDVFGEGGMSNLFSPEWLIERYIQISDTINKGLDVEAYYDRAFFKAKKSETQDEYNKDLSRYYKKLTDWEDKYGQITKDILTKRSRDRMEKANKLYSDNYSNSVPADNTRVDQSYLNTPINIGFDEIINNDEEKEESIEDIITRDVGLFVANMFGVSEDMLKDDLTLSNTKTPKRVDQIKIFQDWLDKYYSNWLSPALNKNLKRGYGKFGPKTARAWKIRGKEFKDLWGLGVFPPKPIKPSKPPILSAGGNEYEWLSSMEKQQEDIGNIIKFITERNKLLKTQKEKYHGTTVYGFCSSHFLRKVSVKKINQYGREEQFKKPIYSPDYFKLCDTSPKGVWIYKGERKTDIGCGCVSPKTGQYQGMDSRGNFESGNFEYIQWTDKRTMGQQFDDWVTGCVEDWHCIADIASIAVLFIPYVGVGLSALIDGISAAGYMIEQDEGWKLNAILTGVGAFGGGAEVYRVFRKAAKVEKITVAMGKAGKEMKALESSINYKNMSKASQAASRGEILQNSLKGLSSKEILDMKEMIKSVHHLNKSGDFSKFLKDMDSLNKLEKSELRNIIKNFDKTPKNKQVFIDGLKESNYDIKKFLKSKTAKILLRQAIFQSTLFILMMKYPEKTGRVILGGLSAIEDLTYKISGKKFDIKKYLVGMVDEDPNDEESEEIKKILDKFVDYESVANEILNITNDTFAEIIEKYKGFNVDAINKKIFDGDDPVIGAPLIDIRDKLNEIYKEINNLINSGATDIDIENKLSNYYITLINMIDDDIQSEKDYETLKNIYEKNPKSGYRVIPNDVEWEFDSILDDD